MSERSFYAQRKKIKVFRTIDIVDSSFDGGHLRYVKDEINPIPLRLASGEVAVFQPANFEVKVPDVGGESQSSSLDIQLGSVAMDVRKKVKQYIKAREINNNLSPTPVIYREFINGRESSTITRWLDNVNFEDNIAAFRSSDDDISNRRVSLIYSAQKFPGLKSF